MALKDLIRSYNKLARKRHVLLKTLDSFKVRLDLLSHDIHYDRNFNQAEWNHMINQLNQLK